MHPRLLTVALAGVAASVDLFVIYLATVQGLPEPVSYLKLGFAILIQLLLVFGVSAFVGLSLKRREPLISGPWEQFRSKSYPYLFFAIGLLFSESLLYNAIACGSQSFIHTTRGEPLCRA